MKKNPVTSIPPSNLAYGNHLMGKSNCISKLNMPTSSAYFRAQSTKRDFCHYPDENASCWVVNNSALTATALLNNQPALQQQPSWADRAQKAQS